MKLNEKFRNLWHDIYYYFSSKRTVDFAMRCKDVVDQVNLRNTHITLSDRIRFHLHISLCQGCKNYLSTSQLLKLALRRLVFNSEKKTRLNKLNEDLLKKYSNDV